MANDIPFPSSKVQAVVYHGTNKEFQNFDLSRRGENTGYENTVHGFFFIEKEEHAKIFGERIIPCKINLTNPIDLHWPAVFTKGDQAPTLVEILTNQAYSKEEALKFLNAEIGLGEIDEFKDEINTQRGNEIMKKNGFDGIISPFGGGEIEYIVFEPEQIVNLNDRKIENRQAITSSKPLLDLSKASEQRTNKRGLGL